MVTDSWKTGIQLGAGQPEFGGTACVQDQVRSTQTQSCPKAGLHRSPSTAEGAVMEKVEKAVSGHGMENGDRGDTGKWR